MEQTWRHASPQGATGLIHPESHFTDEKAGLLRAGTYERLRRHWQFINELRLFEIHNLVTYGTHVYGAPRDPHFLQAASLYHPDTVDRSFDHTGLGDEPSLKDAEGNLDVRPHSGRQIVVEHAVLNTWHHMLEDKTEPVRESRMAYAVNRATATVLDKVVRATRIGSVNLEFSRGWDESIDRQKGRFDSSWGEPPAWEDTILQGPHLHVANPAYKTPNESMKSNKDWSAVDLEALDANAIPATLYKPRGDRKTYDAAYMHWTRDVVIGPDGKPVDGSPVVDPKYVRHVETATRTDGTTVRTETISARAFYRLACRAMAANTGERTLIPALIPPGAAHPNTVFAVGGSTHRELMTATAFASSPVLDTQVQIAPRSNIFRSSLRSPPHHAIDAAHD